MCIFLSVKWRLRYLVQVTPMVIDKILFEKMKHVNQTENIWNPCEDLPNRYKEINYAVVILNVPINFGCNPQFVMNLWNEAKVRLTVDGGTQRWLNWLIENKYDFNNIANPDLITGDMDSLDSQVLRYFENENVKIVRTPDQNETDFTKALKQLQKHIDLVNKDIDMVFVFVETCGRLDQIMANINTLFKARSIMKDTKIILIASSSFTWLLETGRHSILIQENLIKAQEWCALIPIGQPCRVTTTGLKWNLDKGKLEFGSMVSTSNTYDGDPNVTIETDGPVIWSMGIDSLF